MSEVRWLTDEEQRVWRNYLAATGMLREHLERQLNTDAGMPQTYYEVLVTLSESPQHTLRMSELAIRTRSSRSRLSHAVSRMERAGWIARSECPDDKRGSLAQLTDSGFAALRSAAPGHVGAVREAIFDVLSSTQVRQLGDIMAALREGLRAECNDVLRADCDTDAPDRD